MAQEQLNDSGLAVLEAHVDAASDYALLAGKNTAANVTYVGSFVATREKWLEDGDIDNRGLAHIEPDFVEGMVVVGRREDGNFQHTLIGPLAEIDLDEGKTKVIVEKMDEVVETSLMRVVDRLTKLPFYEVESAATESAGSTEVTLPSEVVVEEPVSKDSSNLSIDNPHDNLDKPYANRIEQNPMLNQLGPDPFEMRNRELFSPAQLLDS